MLASRTPQIAAFLLLAGVSSPGPGLVADDRVLVEMLRDAQATRRSEFRQGHANVTLVMARKGVTTPATVEGDLTWSDGDFLLKYKVSDPSKVHFRAAEREFGNEWKFMLLTRDGLRLYDPNTGTLQSRSAGPGAIDPIFNLNPWVQLFGCCPPSAESAMGGRSWLELIGPHPSMKEVMDHSKFEYLHLPDDSIKQIRRDRDGSVNEIVFSSNYDFLVSSMVQRGPSGETEQEGTFQYRRSGKAIIPVECEFYMVSERSAPVVTFRYIFSNWNVEKPVTRAALSVEHFVRMTRELSKSKGGTTDNKKRSGVEQRRLEELADKLKGRGFGAP
jgi:hypothetical protein